VRYLGCVAVSVALCACDNVFGLHQTQPLLFDAKYFDAPIDAPFACPPTGTVPQFSSLLHQDIFQPITEYTISSSTMQAMGLNGGNVAAGMDDEPMQSTTGFPGGMFCGSCAAGYHPRLAPEGNSAYIIFAPSPAIYPPKSPSLTQYLRGSDGTWTPGSSYSVSVAATDFISSVTQAALRRIVIYSSGTDDNFYEYALDDSSGAATLVGTHTPVTLGVEFIQNPMLSSDGLRLVFEGSNMADAFSLTVYYADRSDPSQLFGTATALANVPASDDGQEYLNDDCSRIYVSGLGSMFYAQRQ
jgi:hypothetical protein